MVCSVCLMVPGSSGEFQNGSANKVYTLFHLPHFVTETCSRTIFRTEKKQELPYRLGVPVCTAKLSLQ